MYIESVLLNGVFYEFTNSGDYHTNRYTIIIGENASGKSELLRELIGAIIRAKLGNKEYQSPFVDILDEHLSESYKNNVRQSIKDVDITVNINDGYINSFHYHSYSSSRTVINYKGEKLTLSDGVFRNDFDAKIGNHTGFYPNIIAISSTSYDKFPRVKKNQIMEDGFYICFTSHRIDHSILNRDNFDIRSSSYNIDYQILNFCESLLLSISKSRISMLEEALSRLSFSNEFKVIFSFKDNIGRRIPDEDLNQKQKDAFAYYDSATSNKNPHFFRQIDYTREIIFNCHDLTSDNISIIELSKLNCINFHNVEFFHKKNDKKYLLSTLSSGQLSLIYGLVGLLSRIENNSLIFIDEPEVSLHPKWQEDVLTIYKGI